MAPRESGGPSTSSCFFQWRLPCFFITWRGTPTYVDLPKEGQYPKPTPLKPSTDAPQMVLSFWPSGPAFWPTSGPAFMPQTQCYSRCLILCRSPVGLRRRSEFGGSSRRAGSQRIPPTPPSPPRGGALHQDRSCSTARSGQDEKWCLHSASSGAAPPVSSPGHRGS